MKRKSVFLSVFSLFVATALTAQAQIGIFEANQDIDSGRLGAAGSASYDSLTGTYTIEGSGHDIWDDADNFHFVYRKWSGDFDVQARVSISQGTSDWTKSMIMARATLEGSSINIGTRVRGADGQFSMQRRFSPTEWDSTPGDLRVVGLNGALQRFVKRGNTFTTSYKDESTGEWIEVHSQELSLPDTFLLGFAVTAHTEGEIATGTFSEVSIKRPSVVNTSLVTLQQGVNGYDGTEDAHIISWDGSIQQTARHPDGSNAGDGSDPAYSNLANNTGGHAYIEEGDFGGGSTDSKVILIKFDTSSIAAADARRLARAQIGLYHVYERNAGGGGDGPTDPSAGHMNPHLLSVQPLLKAWDEGDTANGVDGDDADDNTGAVTWNSTGSELWEAIGAEGPSDVGPVISTTYFDTVPGQWVWFDVTPAARQWIANAGSNNGVKISQETDNVPENPPSVYPQGAHNFASSENESVSLRPQLALEFISASNVGSEWSLYR